MDYTNFSREEQNKILRQHGYHWQRITQEWLDDNDDFETVPGWYLYSSDEREVGIEQAFREIEIGVEATTREIRAAEDQKELRRVIDRDLKHMKNEQADFIQKHGVCPQDEQPKGQRVLDTQNIYGGGDWFVIGFDCIWYCRNNGMDGDDWSRNNVRTGGAGAIGWKISMDQKIKEILLGLEDGSLKQKLLAETPVPILGYLVRTHLEDMNGTHFQEIGRTQKRDEVEELIRKFYLPLEYEGIDSVDKEMLDNTEVLYDGRLVGKRNPQGVYSVIWLDE